MKKSKLLIFLLAAVSSVSLISAATLVGCANNDGDGTQIEQPGGDEETPGGDEETPGGEEPKNPAAKNPAAKNPAAKNPAAKNPAAKNPARKILP